VAYEFNVQIRMADVWHVAGTFEATPGRIDRPRRFRPVSCQTPS